MSELMLKSVDNLLGKNYFIPSYQRGYRWGKRQVHDLLEDLHSFAIDTKKKQGAFYCLQPIVVKKCDDRTIAENELHSDMDNNTWYEVIDGQQRLTTLFLIFKFLIKKNNLDLPEDYNTDLFRIQYQTGVTDENIITNPDVPDCSSPNAYYMTEAYQHISAWFNAFPKPKEAREDIQRLLLSNADSKHGFGYVQVIWYETTEADPIKTFTRLNIGKIPLRNAELVKALFLQKRNANVLSKKQQIFIAKEWDQFEATLQDRRVWAFLNSTLPDMPAHIEFIFNVIFQVEGEYEICEYANLEYQRLYNTLPNSNKQKQEARQLGQAKFDEKYGTDEYATFRFFSERFKNADQETIDKEWKIVRDYFETFMEWYNNPLWYHYIGFLIYCNEPIINIYRLYKNNSKSEFLENLVFAIRKNLNITLTNSGDLERNKTPITYTNDKATLKKVLVLYNIEYIIQKNKQNDRSYIVFPFDLFKAEKWDIEHVDSYTTNPLTDKAEQREWVRTALADLATFNINYKANLSNQEILAIENFLEELDKGISFMDIQSIISRLAGEYFPTEEVLKDIKNSVGNLTLLNADINRSYGNSIFPSKKKEITEKDADGRFIPICTKNVFLKNFRGLNNTTISWSEDDMKKYRENIIAVIRKFLIPAQSQEVTSEC